MTRWTLIAGLRRGGAEAHAALEELCRHYWPPIYAYLRQRGFSVHDAEDYTQQFFSEILTDHTLEKAQAAAGRLRTFLLAALNRSLVDQARWRTREKRGGGAPLLSLETAQAEQQYLAEPSDHRDPETLYLAAWARELIAQARRRLRETYGQRAALYTRLESFLDREEKTASYREVAAVLGIPEVTARVHVSRLRKRFAEVLTDEVRQTVATADEVEEELAWLRKAVNA